MSRSIRRVLAACAFAGAGLWLAWGFGREVYRTLELEVLRPPPALPPVVWRYSTPQAVRLRAFMEQVGERVPPGSRAAFASKALGPDDELFRFLWASYWLPEVSLALDDAASAHPVDYWITFRRPLERSGVALVFEEGPGRLYRVVEGAR